MGLNRGEGEGRNPPTPTRGNNQHTLSILTHPINTDPHYQYQHTISIPTHPINLLITHSLNTNPVHTPLYTHIHSSRSACTACDNDNPTNTYISLLFIRLNHLLNIPIYTQAEALAFLAFTNGKKGSSRGDKDWSGGSTVIVTPMLPECPDNNGGDKG